MALVIRKTGLDQYAPGGEARLKLLVIGGPGAGKTRYSSFFPRPIYADCEAGLASVADRTVPYVSVSTSRDMLDLLTHLKQECTLPKDRRTYDTIVVDTLDAYQRKLKNEWMEKEKKETFTGWEAWGFVGQKMQLLLTKLLNLDMNVIVNVHFKDKVNKDEDKETHELQLQLQGDISETAFNDFDLVGWMGVYWEAEGGERVQKRGLTFKPTPDKPFLKDRLYVTPRWLPVEFADSDYEGLFKRVSSRMNDLSPSETIGEIPNAEPDDLPVAGRVDTARSGPLPPQKTPDLPLSQLDKPALLARARVLGVTTLPDGSPIRGNTLKAELVAAIEYHQSLPPVDPNATTVAPAPTTVAMNLANATAANMRAVLAGVPRQAAPPTVEQVAEGLLVDTRTGEILEPGGGGVDVLERPTPAPQEDPDRAVQDATATVAQTLGGQVIQSTPAAGEALARRVEAQRAEAQPPTEQATCVDCGKSLADENPDYVKLAWIKFRKKLCEEHYKQRKAG